MLSYTSRRYESERLQAWSTIGVSKLVTAPSVEPVDEDMVKRHARLNDDESLDYDILPLRIKAAREWAENYTGRVFIYQTWDYTIDWHHDWYSPIWLPKIPLVDITSVTSFDQDGTPTVVSASDYRADTNTSPGRVILTTDGYWASDIRLYGGLAIRYRAGYGTTPESVPAAIRNAILLLTAELSERLEGASDLKLDEVPFGVKSMLDPFVVMA